MTYNVFGGTLNPCSTQPYISAYVQIKTLNFTFSQQAVRPIVYFNAER